MTDRTQLRAITFDEGAMDFIFKAFNFYTGPDGLIRTAHGYKLKALDGQFITKDEFAGVMKTSDGMRAVRKGFLGAIDAYDALTRTDGCVPPKAP